MSRFCSILLIMLVGLGLLPPVTPAAHAQTIPWGDKSSPFGIVAALGNRVRSDEIPAAVRLMREAGVQWQREEIFWHEIQKAPNGPFDWDGNDQGFYNYDFAIAAQREAGINILGLLDYNPAWMKGKNPTLDEWIADWGNYVYNTVARYGRDRGQIKYWELWNEPNLAPSGYESGLYTIADFVRILEVGSAAARAADPQAKIVLGGLASIWSAPPSPYHYDYFDYLDQVARLGGWKHVDIIGIHPYRPDAPEGDVFRRDKTLNFRQEMHRLDEIMLTHGAKPIWFTELGWSATNRWPGVDEKSQAFFMVRAYMMAISHPNIEKVFWYDFRNDTKPSADYQNPVYDPNEPEFHYGLLRRMFPLNPDHPNLRKPAFLAYRAMTQMLGGLYLNEIKRDGDPPDGLFHYHFVGNGRQVAVLWRTNGNVAREISVNCACRKVVVRAWDGHLLKIVSAVDGAIRMRLDAVGAPYYLEFDPPPQGRQVFAATGQSIRGAFQAFWSANGGLARFGYPLSEEILEPEPGSGRPRIVQYFERARFEYFPENAGTPYEIQLTALGDYTLRSLGVDPETVVRVESAPPECRYFPETGHALCPPFLQAWEANGGLALIGLPRSEAFSYEDGRTYQYFERARMEIPNGQTDPQQVVFGLLGRELFTSWGVLP